MSQYLKWYEHVSASLLVQSVSLEWIKRCKSHPHSLFEIAEIKGFRQYKHKKCGCTHIHKCIQKHTQFAQKHGEKTNTNSHSPPISPRCCLCWGLFVKPVESSLWNAKSIDFSLRLFFFFFPSSLSLSPANSACCRNTGFCWVWEKES